MLNIASQILKELVLLNISEVAKATLEESMMERKTEEQTRLAGELRNDIVEESIVNTLHAISSTAIEEYKRELKLKLQLLEKRFRTKLLAKHFKIWRGFTLRARKQRQAISDFPAAPSLLTAQEQINSLVGFSGSGINNQTCATLTLLLYNLFLQL